MTAAKKMATGRRPLDLVWWANNTGLLAAVFTAFAALLGVASWVLSGRVSDAKDAALVTYQENASKELDAEKDRRGRMELALEQQKESTAKAQKELLEIQERARPRTIDDAARKAMVHWLEINPPTGTFRMMFVNTTTEAADFSKAIEEVLTAARWKVSHRGGVAFLGRLPIGLRIWYSDKEPSMAAIVLADAFQRAGFSSTFEKRAVTEVKIDETVLLVGAKP